jgi:hypothetical protein
MMRILSILRNILFYRDSKIPLLGRWQIEKCNIKLSNKIKLSNEDHCGSCGDYENIKILSNEQNISIKK